MKGLVTTVVTGFYCFYEVMGLKPVAKPAVDNLVAKSAACEHQLEVAQLEPIKSANEVFAKYK